MSNWMLLLVKYHIINMWIKFYVIDLFNFILEYVPLEIDCNEVKQFLK